MKWSNIVTNGKGAIACWVGPISYIGGSWYVLVHFLLANSVFAYAPAFSNTFI